MNAVLRSDTVGMHAMCSIVMRAHVFVAYVIHLGVYSYMQRMRAEFWDTQPHYGGDRVIWDALKVAWEHAHNAYGLWGFAVRVMGSVNVTKNALCFTLG